jgi:hypothetical protein
MRQSLVKAILHDAPANPYIDGLIFQEDPSWEMIVVEHQDRLSGQSGYTFRRLVSLWLNILITADRTEDLQLTHRFRAMSLLTLGVLAAFWLPWVLALAVVFPKTSLGLLIIGAWVYGWCGWVLVELTTKMEEELSGVDPFTIIKRLGRLSARDPVN